MEKQSIFEQLAERFSKCRTYISEKVETEPIEAIMQDAGKELFDAISSGRIRFDLTPMRLKREPKSIEWLTNPFSEPEEVECYGWSFYWVVAADWLHRAKCGHKEEPPGTIFWAEAVHYLGGHSVWEYLHTIKHVKIDSESWRQTWEGLIRASKYVCLYLADMIKQNPPETTPAKGGWVSNLCWKLYEKTLGVIVNAILNHFWQN